MITNDVATNLPFAHSVFGQRQSKFLNNFFFHSKLVTLDHWLIFLFLIFKIYKEIIEKNNIKIKI